MTGGGGSEFWVHLGAEENDQTGQAAGAESLSTPRAIRQNHLKAQ